MNSIQPIFIFGYGHSGTSLMTGILRSHKDVCCGVHETYFFEFPYLYERRIPDLNAAGAVTAMIQFCANLVTRGYWRLFVHRTEKYDDALLPDEDVEVIRQRLPGSPNYTDIFRMTLDRLAELEGRRNWVEKTPGHTFHASSILASIPDAKAIELIRDPRDILASRKIRDKRLRERIRNNTATDREKQQRGMVEYDTLWTSLSWRSAVRSINEAKRKYKDRIYSLRYEDLVANPEGQIKNICRFLNISFDESILQVEQTNVATWSKEDRRAGTGIVSDSVERWRKTLNSGESALATRLLFNELKQHNYSIDPLAFRHRLASVITAIAGVPGLARRLFSKVRYQGLSYTLAASLNYVKRTIRK